MFMLSSQILLLFIMKIHYTIYIVTLDHTHITPSSWPDHLKIPSFGPKGESVLSFLSKYILYSENKLKLKHTLATKILGENNQLPSSYEL